MRSFILLAKLRIKLFTKSFIRKQRFSGIITAIVWFAVLIFMLFIVISYSKFYSSLCSSPNNIASLLFSFQVISISLLLLMQIVPTFASDIADEHGNISFFLPLPIHKGALLLDALFGSIISAFLLLMIFLPMIAGYVTGCFSPSILLSIVVFLLFLCATCLLASATMLKVIGTSFAKRLAKWMAMLNVLVFIVLWQFTPYIQREISNAIRTGKSLEPSSFPVDCVSPFSPFAWISHFFSGDIVLIALVLVLTILFWRVGWHMTETLRIEKPSRWHRKTASPIRFLTSQIPFIRRDSIILLRDAETFLALAYPIIFPILLTFVFQVGIEYTLIISVMLSIQYSQIISVKLASIDTKFARWSSTQPVKWRAIIIRRSLMLAIMWTTVLIYAAIAISILMNLQISFLPITIIAFEGLFAATVFAQYIWLIHPNRDTIAPRRALGVKAIAPAFFTTTLIAIPLFIPEIAKLSNISIHPWMEITSVICIIIAAIEVIVVLLVSNSKKVTAMFQR